jgi:hypothetical protein
VSCVKKMRKRHAVRKMKEGPSEPPCRGRLQTAVSCFGQKPRCGLFALWQLGARRGLRDGSCMSREAHVQF